MTGRETLKQNSHGSKGERDTKKSEKPSPEPALAGFCTRETEAHIGISLCPLKILSVGRTRLTTCSLSLSPDFLLLVAHLRKEELQWAPGTENTISTLEIRRNRVPWDMGSEFSFSLV